MADAKDTSKYTNGSGDDSGWDTVGDNPTGNPRKSSAKKRRQKDRKLFGGTLWGKPKDDPKK